jgi:hypothetical protein
MGKQDEWIQFARRLRDEHGVSRDDLGHVLLAPSEAPDDTACVERIGNALGDCLVALTRLTGSRDRDELSPEQVRARWTMHWVHEALEALAGVGGDVPETLDKG